MTTAELSAIAATTEQLSLEVAFQSARERSRDFFTPSMYVYRVCEIIDMESFEAGEFVRVVVTAEEIRPTHLPFEKDGLQWELVEIFERGLKC